MKKLLLITASLLALSACGSEQATTVNDGKTHQLTIELGDITRPEGDVKLFLYKSTDDLRGDPTQLTKAYSLAQARQPIVINDIPTGDYAIFVMQDLDGDGDLKMSAQGMPLEPYGYSQNPTLMGPPSMNQVKFAVTADTVAKISFY
ncbi:DUF2141 domain-containing protein [Motilimonas cestriensis]|uniref:DUF2141 domain-containing protein n=1 Tax=Motilimonas cestriensis TaxID=2742685 RepID=A0ABS8W433_9GAMM|nr:DUF2141 domain-containing protein [Motilimonas cestriensis]MCE2593709.1 DUF2141 domain-containing protein [Motilimonas cestriensis]